MRRALRWLRRILVAVSAIVVIAILVVVIALHTDWGRDLVRRRAEAALQAAYPGSRIGKLTGSVFGTLVAHDVKLFALDHRELATIETLELEVSLLPLLGKTARVDSLIARGVIMYARDKAPAPLDDGSPPTTWSIELPHVEIHDAQVIVEATTTPRVRLDVAASMYVPAGGPIQAMAMLDGIWDQRSIRGLALVNVGGDVTGFASFGVGGGYLVASDVAVRERRGSLVARLPAAELAALAPRLPVQGDARVVVAAAPRGHETQVVLAASVGVQRLDAVALVDLEARRGRGVVGTSALELGAVTGGRLTGHGRAVVAATFDGTRTRATLIAGGAVPGYPAGNTVVAVDGELHPDGAHVGLELLDRADFLVFATGDGGLRVATVAAVKRVDRTFVIERSQLGASVADPEAATAGRAPLHGALAVEVSATGPVTALAVQGKMSGAALHYERLRVARLAGTFRATLDQHPLGSTHLALGGVANEGNRVGALVIDASNRTDGRIDVRAHVRSAAAPIVADVTAVVTPGVITEIALGPHRLDTPVGIWRGTGGHVRLEPRAMVVSGIRTAQGDAWVKVAARLGRRTDAIVADLEAHALPVATLDPRRRGTISGALAVSRNRGQWSGGGMISGTGLALGPDTIEVDAGVTLEVVGRRVTVAINASNEELGGARVALEVDGPKDLLRKEGWLRVARGDLHAITIGLDQVDVAALSKGKTAGKLDGTLEIRDGVPSGTLRVRGLPTPAGTADADLTLALTDVGFVDAIAKANVGVVGAATLGARLAVPDHPFDPAEWKALGTHVVHSVTAAANEVVIDPRLLSAFHIDAPFHGLASVKLDLGPGASSATVAVDVRNVTGGPLVRGIDLHIEGTADAQGTRGALRVSSGATTLAAISDAATPVTLDRWLTDARSALTAPLSGSLVIGTLDAKQALAIVGRADVRGGTVEGRITAGGTIGVPTAVGTLDLRNVTVARQFSTKPPPALTALHVDASWGGAAGHLRITADEEGKGTLLVDAQGRPDDPTSLFGTVTIHKLDLAPIVVFLPGPLAGASGTLDADLAIRGVDPALGMVRGRVVLIEGRVPISPAIGTLRKANVTLAIEDRGITAKLDGRLGAGSVTLTATADPNGIDTVIDAKLTKVSPIGALQPILSATLHGNFHRVAALWTGKLAITRASVLVPAEGGHALLDAAAPDDLIFVDLPIPHLAVAARAPEHPWLIVDVALAPTQITVPEFVIDAVAGGKVQVSVGESLGLEGLLSVERGTADLFGHRYRVEIGQLVFDGTTDGLVDLKIAHDFSDVTMFVRFAGRLSQLTGQEPEFSSAPGVYSQGQLLGFFLGGEPGGDPTKQTREAAVGFGAALASTRIGKRFKRYLPINIDVLRCDPGAGTTGASCTLGTWLTHEVFLSYKQQLGSRYDENSGEGAVEWHFRPSWELDVSGGDRNFYGGDILWRRRW